jgi:hypothetical protein
MASKAVLQRLSLLQELEGSLLAIEAGLTELRESQPYHSRHFIFLILLSTGLERFMKVILHLHALETTGGFLTMKQVKCVYGHNVLSLCGAITTGCFTPIYVSRPIAAEDHVFIQNDPRLREVLTI